MTWGGFAFILITRKIKNKRIFTIRERRKAAAMNRSEAKQAAKNKLEEYLIIVTSKKGNQYICPICGSGKGKNKTPAGQFNKDDQTYHCYSCNFHGDIFGLVGQIEGIADDAEKFKRVYEMFNINADSNQTLKLKSVRVDEKNSQSESPNSFGIFGSPEFTEAEKSKNNYTNYRR